MAFFYLPLFSSNLILKSGSIGGHAVCWKLNSIDHVHDHVIWRLALSRGVRGQWEQPSNPTAVLIGHESLKILIFYRGFSKLYTKYILLWVFKWVKTGLELQYLIIFPKNKKQEISKTRWRKFVISHRNTWL